MTAPESDETPSRETRELAIGHTVALYGDRFPAAGSDAASINRQLIETADAIARFVHSGAKPEGDPDPAATVG